MYLKLFFLLTPFFTLTAFLTMTAEMDTAEKRKTAVKTAAAILAITLALLFFGKHIFAVFGITLDAFRIGAGGILFISSVALVRGEQYAPKNSEHGDIAVVPLALPITVGPGTIGAMLVMGSDLSSPGQLAVGIGALAAAAATLGLLLLSSELIEKILRRRGLLILSKITGLFIAALAAQITSDGIRGMIQAGS